MPELHRFTGFKCLFHLQDHRIIRTIAKLQFLEQSFKVIKILDMLFSSNLVR